MNREQYNNLENNPQTINVSVLQDQSDRTLLWGYTLDRLSFHVYILDGVLYRYVYDIYGKGHSIHGDIPVAELVPNKRLYPEACDYEFCSLLKRYGVNLPFTNFNDDRREEQYYGDLDI